MGTPLRLLVPIFLGSESKIETIGGGV